MNAQSFGLRRSGENGHVAAAAWRGRAWVRCWSRALVLVGSLVTACAAFSHSPLATVVVDTREGYPIAKVEVNHHSLRLMLDLGATQAVALRHAAILSTGVAPLDGVAQFIDSSGAAFSGDRFVAHTLSLNSLSVGDVAGSELPDESGGPASVEGLIGFPILSQYLLVLDYPNHRVRLYPSGDLSALMAECGSATFPLYLDKGTVKSRLSTQYGDLDALWDTGTTSNFLRPSAIPSANDKGRTVDDGPKVLVVRQLSLGGVPLPAQEFRLVQFVAPDDDVVLGAGLLASHRVCLDVPRLIGAVRLQGVTQESK